MRPPAGGRWFIEAHPFRIDTRDGVLGFAAEVWSVLGEKLVAALAVNETDELMLMTSKGQSVRIRVGGEKGIRETGRNAQGVKLMDLREGAVIQDVALVAGFSPQPTRTSKASDATTARVREMVVKEEWRMMFFWISAERREGLWAVSIRLPTGVPEKVCRWK